MQPVAAKQVAQSLPPHSVVPLHAPQLVGAEGWQTSSAMSTLKTGVSTQVGARTKSSWGVGQAANAAPRVSAKSSICEGGARLDR